MDYLFNPYNAVGRLKTSTFILIFQIRKLGHREVKLLRHREVKLLAHSYYQALLTL